MHHVVYFLWIKDLLIREKNGKKGKIRFPIPAWYHAIWLPCASCDSLKHQVTPFMSCASLSRHATPFCVMWLHFTPCNSLSPHALPITPYDCLLRCVTPCGVKWVPFTSWDSLLNPRFRSGEEARDGWIHIGRPGQVRSSRPLQGVDHIHAAAQA